jgi:hypothetical protein
MECNIVIFDFFRLLISKVLLVLTRHSRKNENARVGPRRSQKEKQ